MKIHPAGVESSLADRRKTNTMKLISWEIHGYRGPFLWEYSGRYASCEANHSSSFIAEVKNEWSYASTP